MSDTGEASFISNWVSYTLENLSSSPCREFLRHYESGVAPLCLRSSDGPGRRCAKPHRTESQPRQDEDVKGVIPTIQHHRGDHTPNQHQSADDEGDTFTLVAGHERRQQGENHRRTAVDDPRQDVHEHQKPFLFTLAARAAAPPAPCGTEQEDCEQRHHVPELRLHHSEPPLLLKTSPPNAGQFDVVYMPVVVPFFQW